MILFSNKLLVLLAADTMKTGAFTGKDLVAETLEMFPKWFSNPEASEPTLRSTVSSFVRQGLITQIGDSEIEVPELGKRPKRPFHIYCFTDEGRKQRMNASRQIDTIIAEVEKIIASDLRSNVHKIAGRKKAAA